MNSSVKDNLSFHAEKEIKIDKVIEIEFDFYQSRVVNGLNLFEKKKRIDENLVFESDLITPSFDVIEDDQNEESFGETLEEESRFRQNNGFNLKSKNRKRLNIKKISSLIYEKIQEKHGRLDYENIENLINKGKWNIMKLKEIRK